MLIPLLHGIYIYIYIYMYSEYISYVQAYAWILGTWCATASNMVGRQAPVHL